MDVGESSRLVPHVIQRETLEAKATRQLASSGGTISSGATKRITPACVLGHKNSLAFDAPHLAIRSFRRGQGEGLQETSDLRRSPSHFLRGGAVCEGLKADLQGQMPRADLDLFTRRRRYEPQVASGVSLSLAQTPGRQTCTQLARKPQMVHVPSPRI